MKVDLPMIVLSPDRVQENRDVIAAARAAYRGALAALEGLAKANAAMCSHPHKTADYDPGYAGGGMCGYNCPDCGASGWLT